jgi:zinc protease
MEDPAKTATYASNILINGLPKDYYRTFLQKVNAVTLSDVQRVSKKYFEKDNSRIVIVGNGSKILPNLSRLGYPVKLYDKFANPIENKEKEVNIKSSEMNSEAISAFTVIDGYLKAIGGKEEAKKINTIKSTLSMEFMGAKLDGVEMKMAPNKRSTVLKMGEMKVMEALFDGAKGYQAQMGQKKELDEKEIKEAQDDRALIPQLYYLTNDYQLSYLGVEKINDEQAYKLKVTRPSGKVATEYYSAKTGLLLREESSTSAQGQEITITTDYADYKKAGNIMMPYSITQNAAGQEFQMIVSDIKINEGVSEGDFK